MCADNIGKTRGKIRLVIDLKEDHINQAFKPLLNVEAQRSDRKWVNIHGIKSQ
jgi:hypothetical protein